MQTTLTQLVDRHRKAGVRDKAEFLEVLLDCEQVHIVTFQENYAAMKADGNYRRAGIALLSWKSIPLESRHYLWKKMLQGRVANAAEFRPKL
jgi:hypothetical protein